MDLRYNGSSVKIRSLISDLASQKAALASRQPNINLYGPTGPETVSFLQPHFCSGYGKPPARLMTLEHNFPSILFNEALHVNYQKCACPEVTRIDGNGVAGEKSGDNCVILNSPC